jgi:hypothetical protein
MGGKIKQRMIWTPAELGAMSATMARMIAKKVAASQLGAFGLCEERSHVMAANVGAFAKGTATRWVQLARFRPVKMYKTIRSPALVRL